MNFIDTFIQGQTGFNQGLDMGIPSLNRAINGLQRKSTIGIAAAPKVGKTTFTDFACIISPYLEALKKGTVDKLNWIYYSYEIDRVSKEFEFAAFFMYHDYGLFNFEYKGTRYPMSSNYLTGRLLHTNSDGTIEVVKVSLEHKEKLKTIYQKWIVPLFGEYNSKGVQVKKGKIIYIEEAENPTGIYKSLVGYATVHGEIVREKYRTVDENKKEVIAEKIVGYVPKDPEAFHIIITDHVRKLKKERGFTMKENIDKFLEYTTILRNRFSFTFIHIIHLHRGLANVDRLKMLGEFVYPTGDDVKDTGNVGEECTILLTMFKPQDEKYGLEKHFGVELADYPNYRSIHVADQRYGESPLHIQVNMFGNVNNFTPII
jgi:hypothetical protein